MKKIIKILDTIVIAGGYIAGICCLLLTLIVTFGVIQRYGLKTDSSWTMECSQYIFCGITLLASGYALLQNTHAKIDVFRMYFSARTNEYLDLIQYPIIFSVCAVLIWLGGGEFLNVLANNYRSESVLGLPLWPVWSTIPLGGLLLMLAAISGFLKFFYK